MSAISPKFLFHVTWEHLLLETPCWEILTASVSNTSLLSQEQRNTLCNCFQGLSHTRRVQQTKIFTCKTGSMPLEVITWYAMIYWHCYDEVIHFAWGQVRKAVTAMSECNHISWAGQEFCTRYSCAFLPSFANKELEHTQRNIIE